MHGICGGAGSLVKDKSLKKMCFRTKVKERGWETH